MVLFLYTLFLTLCLFSLRQGYFIIRLGSGITLSFSADSSSLFFFCTLGLIAFCVLIWSYYYLSDTKQFQQFFWLVFLFLGSMHSLIFSTNLLTLFISWDLLGFSSFFLVIYYSTRHSISSGLLTSFLNRLGDCFFFILFGLHGFFESPVTGFSLSVLILISMTKSAQVPFSSWLPAAIAAPTPVSALVHSSTLVTAGLYLLYRFLPLSSSFLVNIGILTTLLAGLAACLEADIKKVIAYSTLSQLGVIFVSLGLGSKAIIFGHLLSHAGFKALMFMAIGVVIHISYGGQESRTSSVLLCTSPVVSVCLGISSLCLCGVAFTSGWFSKEGILLSCFAQGSSLFQLLVFYISLGLTATYTIRLLISCFSGGNGMCSSLGSVSANANIKLPFAILISLSLLQCLYFQGVLKPLGSYSELSDTLIFYCCCGLGLWLGCYISQWGWSCDSVLSQLGWVVSGTPRLVGPLSLISHTDVAGLQGLALGNLGTVFSKHDWYGLSACKVAVLLGAALVLL